ncbi:hypothetical protein Clacol_003773 [Clathrus columnatus]|uniref:RING-type E3 ubiquitin transferase n=1 Tax=Clathrus columnatus TaxID=1419009 RepID=A0AAV5AC92_9AGAM|nr:hypothetical protein Clacol_003773 [Clathrus columnatus]
MALLGFPFADQAQMSLQTLGEEYTDIWTVTSRKRLPSRKWRLILALASTLPSYMLHRFLRYMNENHPDLSLTKRLSIVPNILDLVSEVNLMAFYFWGSYYQTIKRLFRFRNVILLYGLFYECVFIVSQITTIPPNPNLEPPSYSLLGVFISIRLAYQSIKFASSLTTSFSRTMPYTSTSEKEGENELLLDQKSVSSLLKSVESTKPEDDENTVLNVSQLSEEEKSSRRCALSPIYISPADSSFTGWGGTVKLLGEPVGRIDECVSGKKLLGYNLPLVGFEIAQ